MYWPKHSEICMWPYKAAVGVSEPEFGSFLFSSFLAFLCLKSFSTLITDIRMLLEPNNQFIIRLETLVCPSMAYVPTHSLTHLPLIHLSTLVRLCTLLSCLLTCSAPNTRLAFPTIQPSIYPPLNSPLSFLSSPFLSSSPLSSSHPFPPPVLPNSLLTISLHTSYSQQDKTKPHNTRLPHHSSV